MEVSLDKSMGKDSCSWPSQKNGGALPMFSMSSRSDLQEERSRTRYVEDMTEVGIKRLDFVIMTLTYTYDGFQSLVLNLNRLIITVNTLPYIKKIHYYKEKRHL